MKLHDAASCNNRRANESHPPPFPDDGVDLDVDCEAAFVLDRVCAKRFHGRARVLAIKGYRIVATDLYAARQAEQIVDSTRPDQRIVSEIALPRAGVVRCNFSNLCGYDQIDNHAIQDEAKLKLLRSVMQRPAMLEWQRTQRPRTSALRQF